MEDLQWADAVPMFERLIALTAERGLDFGVKLTNTFPVDVTRGELPSDEMYMSGRTLFSLTIEVARRITEQFDGRLRISYSGGATVYNIRSLFDAGIWPITLATDVLKPGGYERMSQIAGEFDNLDGRAFEGISLDAVVAIQADSLTNPLYRNPLRKLPSAKVPGGTPLMDCFTAPCRTGCPISQDIPAYLAAVEEGRFEDAFSIIIERNALPHITGTICPHPCGKSCERAFYEPEGAQIRASKLRAAHEAFATVLPKLQAGAPGKVSDKNVAVIGGGPAGLAVAFFLSRAGVPVTIFEAKDALGGIVRHVIPEFRIASADIDADVELCRAFGVEVKLGARVESIEALKAEGYTDVVVATGAWLPGSAGLGEGAEMDVLEFLEAAKKAPETLSLGTDVVVIGAGNTAMDAARVAKRAAGVENVRLVYRRTKAQMPADEEELDFALADGVEFMELLAPVSLADGQLTCNVMRLGEPDASGRRAPEPTGETVTVPRLHRDLRGGRAHRRVAVRGRGRCDRPPRPSRRRGHRCCRRVGGGRLPPRPRDRGRGHRRRRRGRPRDRERRFQPLRGCQRTARCARIRREEGPSVPRQGRLHPYPLPWLRGRCARSAAMCAPTAPTWPSRSRASTSTRSSMWTACATSAATAPCSARTRPAAPTRTS